MSELLEQDGSAPASCWVSINYRFNLETFQTLPNPKVVVVVAPVRRRSDGLQSLPCRESRAAASSMTSSEPPGMASESTCL